MNKFQKEVWRRKRKSLKLVGLGDVSLRTYLGWIRTKLKKDIKEGKVKF